MNYKEIIYKNYTSLNSLKTIPNVLSNNLKRGPLYNFLITNFFPKNKDIKILDLGCGYGDFVWFMTKKGFLNVIGIDNSNEMITAGKNLGVSQIVKDDVINYLKNLPSNSFDVITAIDIIEHFKKEDLFHLIREIHRVLNSNGSLITHQPNADSPFVNSILYGDFTHELAFTRQSMSQLVLSNGFESLQSYEVKPLIHGIKSFLRYILWVFIIKNLLLIFNLVETGSFSFKTIMSRNFITVSKKKKSKNLLIYASHPIQYHVPIFIELTKNKTINTTVMFGDNIGLKEVYSDGFNSTIKWDVPLTKGYNHFFLYNLARTKISGFFSRINFGVFKVINKRDYDYILVHGYQTLTCWIILLVAKIKGVKIIFRGEAIIKKQKTNVINLIKRWAISIYLKNVDAILYSCKGNYDYWKTFFVDDKKLFFIPCAVDNEFFLKNRISSIKRINEIRKEMNISKDDFVIIFPSRFTDRKKPFDLINAVATSSRKNIVILFVGDGPNRKKMEALCLKTKVRAVFTGFINQKSISKYYSISNMVAIISEYDASPKSLNEALNFGLPGVISNMVGTAEDLIIENYNGFIVNVGDIKDISNKINKLMDDKKTFKKMSTNSETLIKEWSLKNDVKGIISATKYVDSEIAQ